VDEATRESVRWRCALSVSQVGAGVVSTSDAACWLRDPVRTVPLRGPPDLDVTAANKSQAGLNNRSVE